MNLKINQKPFSALLIQDGSLDAVLRVKNILTGETKILRFSPGTVARTQWGTIPADEVERQVKQAFKL
jgi:hypothetical protein